MNEKEPLNEDRTKKRWWVVGVLTENKKYRTEKDGGFVCETTGKRFTVLLLDTSHKRE